MRANYRVKYTMWILACNPKGYMILREDREAIEDFSEKYSIPLAELEPYSHASLHKATPTEKGLELAQTWAKAFKLGKDEKSTLNALKNGHAALQKGFNIETLNVLGIYGRIKTPHQDTVQITPVGSFLLKAK